MLIWALGQCEHVLKQYSFIFVSLYVFFIENTHAVSLFIYIFIMIIFSVSIVF